jgi:hypothetical protein
MNRRPGQIKVTIETGYCSFCDRTRNLRREERHLGTLVRTIVACESCHRTLSSTMGVAGPGAPAAEEAAAEVATEAVASPEPVSTPKPKPAAKTAKRAGAARSTPAPPKTKAPKSRAAKSK